MRASAVNVIAVGKAAGPMLTAFVQSANVRVQTAIGIGPAQPGMLPSEIAWFEAGHPVPDKRSVAAARGALQVADRTADDDLLIVLLSGGASALMALPAEGLTLGDKQETVRRLLKGGATIHELNTVRKHLSAIKGGRLAAATRAAVVTLVISDVVGDDLSVIGSGPTMPDPSTFADALHVLDTRGRTRELSGGRRLAPRARSTGRHRRNAEAGQSPDPAVSRTNHWRPNDGGCWSG
jgi:glycerate-2-kinase